MWIFAYGSLIFRPSFEYVEHRAAWVRGFARRFWQGSPDHRGTPERPGRVVTLVPAPREVCGGRAYRIDPARADAVLAALDHREKAGFDRVTVPLLEGPDGMAFGEGLAYVAREDNAHFLGPLDEREIAAQIAESRGPSGPNRAYLLALHAELRALGVDDPHVEAIVSALPDARPHAPRRLVWRDAPEGVTGVLELDPVRAPPMHAHEPARYRIGRRADLCDLCLPLESVGRQHAFIDAVSGGWELTAVGSLKQPVYVNGVECAFAADGWYRQRLHAGDVIQLGDDPRGTIDVE